MVDLLQEWDRYTVSRESAFSGAEPLQNIDVELSYSNRIQLKYPEGGNGKGWHENVRDILEKNLKDWKKIVNLPETVN
ncbi:MAG: hypothetical protein ACXW1U_14265 [Methylobacter sp.]